MSSFDLEARHWLQEKSLPELNQFRIVDKWRSDHCRSSLESQVGEKYFRIENTRTNSMREWQLGGWMKTDGQKSERAPPRLGSSPPGQHKCT